MPCIITAVLKKLKANAQSMSGLGSHPTALWYHAWHFCILGIPGTHPGRNFSCNSLSSYVTDCSIIIRTRALDHVNGKVRLAKFERGWPSVTISQSKIPITFASVLWKTRLSSLKSPCTSVSQSSGRDFLSAKKETISTWCGNLPTSRL